MTTIGRSARSARRCSTSAAMRSSISAGPSATVAANRQLTSVRPSRSLTATVPTCGMRQRTVVSAGGWRLWWRWRRGGPPTVSAIATAVRSTTTEIECAPLGNRSPLRAAGSSHETSSTIAAPTRLQIRSSVEARWHGAMGGRHRRLVVAQRHRGEPLQRALRERRCRVLAHPDRDLQRHDRRLVMQPDLAIREAPDAHADAARERVVEARGFCVPSIPLLPDVPFVVERARHPRELRLEPAARELVGQRQRARFALAERALGRRHRRCKPELRRVDVRREPPSR